ncbi:MAG: hypothetical protein M3R43_12715, partial [Acidobacteriota bacterium]|nr:hypothetical protein [Acidobacteriota bacterium]
MTTVSTRIEFRQNNGESRSNEFSVNVPEDVDEGREVRVARTIFAEVGVVFSPKSLPIHNATALAWLNFPNVPADFSELHDIQNSQGLWQELTNLVLSTEHDLIDAFAFKSLEPVEEPAFENDPEIEQLHYLHNRKMELLDQSVYKLIKVQDLVNRLLHESLGGDLVDT